MVPRLPAAAGFVLAAFAVSAPAPAPAAPPPAVPPAVELAGAATDVVALVNVERRRHGLRPLWRNRRLDRAAMMQARAMVVRQFFAHVDPNGTSPLDRILASGYRPRRASENLAWGIGPLGTPTEIVQLWLRSPTHRPNVLHRRMRETGAAVITGVPEPGRVGGLTYVQTYGLR